MLGYKRTERMKMKMKKDIVKWNKYQGLLTLELDIIVEKKERKRQLRQIYNQTA